MMLRSKVLACAAVACAFTTALASNTASAAPSKTAARQICFDLKYNECPTFSGSLSNSQIIDFAILYLYNEHPKECDINTDRGTATIAASKVDDADWTFFGKHPVDKSTDYAQYANGKYSIPLSDASELEVTDYTVKSITATGHDTYVVSANVWDREANTLWMRVKVTLKRISGHYVVTSYSEHQVEKS